MRNKLKLQELNVEQTVRSTLRDNIVRMLKSHVLPVLLGAAGGYAYYYFIGCYGGACPITSNPTVSALYGAVIAWLVAPRKEKRETNQQNEVKE